MARLIQIECKQQQLNQNGGKKTLLFVIFSYIEIKKSSDNDVESH